MRKTPLAWLQLTYQKPRMIVAMVGIAFLNVLMFMQLGFESALYDSATRLNSSLKADLIMISRRSKSLANMRQFSSRLLYQAVGIDGVDSASPLYIDLADWKNPRDSDSHAIVVFGFQPETIIFNSPEVNENINKLKFPDTIIFERSSRAEYGFIATEFEQNKNTVLEISNYRVRVVGLFTLGSSLIADSYVMTSEQNFLRLLRNRRYGEIDIGLITLKPGVAPQKILYKLANKLPKHIRILTYQEFIDFEKEYLRTSTPIGFIFALGTGMGFVVGTVFLSHSAS